jgi:hypothetical protein
LTNVKKKAPAKKAAIAKKQPATKKAMTNKAMTKKKHESGEKRKRRGTWHTWMRKSCTLHVLWMNSSLLERPDGTK